MVVSANIDPPGSAAPSVFALVGRAELVHLVTNVAQHAPSAPPALILLGETGIGKSVLLHAAVLSAPDAGVRVLFAAGKESAARKVYGSLNQLLWPLMEHCERLPTCYAKRCSMYWAKPGSGGGATEGACGDPPCGAVAHRGGS